MNIKKLFQSKKSKMDYLIYVAIALLIVNFLLIFFPFVEVYQPSYKKIVMDVTTYEDWYTQLSSMASFIFPLFLTGIPYVCSITSLLSSLGKKKKSVFLKIKNHLIEKPVKFFWLKFASIFNLFAMYQYYSTLQDEVRYLREYGAYCRITLCGILNVICTGAFVIVLFAISGKTKTEKFLNNDQHDQTMDGGQIEEAKIKEIEG